GITTLRQYAVGDKQFPTVVIILTIVATWVTGSGLIQSQIYNRGIIGFLTPLKNIIALFYLGILCLRSSSFLNHLTIAESIGSLYGIHVRRLIAVGYIICNIGTIALQLKVVGVILGILFQTSPTLITVLSGCILISYTTLGGIKAVTFTDILQFISFSIFIPLLSLTIWLTIDKGDFMAWITKDVQNIIPNLKLAQEQATILTTFLLFPPLVFSSPMFQRMQMTKNIYQAKKSFVWTAFLGIVIWIIVLGINLMLKYQHPGEPTKLPVYVYLFKTCGKGIQGLIAIGLIAMSMSTSDSFLNSSAVLFTNDLMPKNYSKKLLVAKISAIFIGLLSIVLALKGKTLRNIAITSSLISIPIITPIILLTLLGFRTSTRVIFLSSFCGFLGGSILPVFLPIIKLDDRSNLVQGTLAFFVCFFVNHYLLEEEGRVGTKDLKPLQLSNKSDAWWWENFKSNLSFSSWYEGLIFNLPKKQTHYFFIGLYGFLTNYFMLYSLPQNILDSTFTQAIFGTLFLAISLVMLYPAFPPFMKGTRLAALGYPGMTMYVFFIASPILYALSGYQNSYLLLILCHLIVSLYMFSTSILLAMLGLGILISYLILTYKGVPLFFLSLSGTNSNFLGLGCVLLVVFLILFRHRITTQNLFIQNHHAQRIQNILRQNLFELRSEPEQLAHRLGNGKNNGLSKIQKDLEQYISKREREKVPNHILQEVREINDQLNTQVTYLDKLIYDLQSGGYAKKEPIHLGKLLHTLQERYKAGGNKLELLIRNYTPLPKFYGDSEKIEDALTLLLEKASQVTEETPYLFLSVKATKIKYPHSTLPYDALAFGITTLADEPTLQAVYTYPEQLIATFSSIQITAHTHYGHLEKLKEQSYNFILPQDLRKIQPKIGKTPVKQLSNEVVLHAQEVEATFWLKLKAQKNAIRYDVKRIKEALDVMKNYHGHQMRRSGKLFYTHPITVATKVLTYTDQEDAIITALLHDIIEDTPKILEGIELMFGKRVKELLVYLTNLYTHFKTYQPADKTEKTIQLCLSKDKEAILVKLCDRLHNMETIASMPPHKQKAKAQETLMIYVPLAKSIGFNNIANTLEKLCGNVL
ncbi:MAG: HD domain-containing protein, partial [Bacteroidota bacterium]